MLSLWRDGPVKNLEKYQPMRFSGFLWLFDSLKLSYIASMSHISKGSIKEHIATRFPLFLILLA